MTIKSQILISDTNIKLTELISTLYNVMLLAFYRAIDQSKTIFNLVNGFMDEYEDESGVDTANSINESYNSSDDYYNPSFDSGFDSETKLLLHLNNNVTDEIGKTVTNNNVTFSDTIKKLGSHAASFNGTTSYLSVPDSDDWTFGTGDFTIDCWVRLNDNSSSQTIVQQDVDGTNFWSFEINSHAANNLFFLSQSSGAGLLGFRASFSQSIGVWYHVAVVRSSGTMYMFVDGVSKSLTFYYGNGSENLPNLSGPLLIGDGIYDNLDGYIDELRVSKGIARWTSDFTPPTAEYAPEVYNMTLKSNVQVADSVPTSARIVLFEEDVDSITINTDLKAYISRDNGTTFSQVTLTNEGYYATSKNILCGLVDISGQPSGTNMKYKIETLNEKNLKIHGVGINWA